MSAGRWRKGDAAVFLVDSGDRSRSAYFVNWGRGVSLLMAGNDGRDFLRVGMDIRILQGEDAYRGIGHYVRGLTEALLRLARDRERGEEAGPRLDIVLFWDARRSPPQLEYEGAEAQVEVWPEEEGRFRSRLREWGIGSAPDARALVRAAHRARVEVLHIGSPLHGPFEWCVAKGLPLVATVFDLIPGNGARSTWTCGLWLLVVVIWRA